MLLSFEKTKELLEKRQIPIAESLIIENIHQGIEFANQVGFPVVLKLLVSENLHKVDKGLVKLNIQNAQDLESAWKELNSFHLEGVKLLQKQIGGTELFLGMKRDKAFGPVIGFGLGGIFIEVLNDIVFGICPISQKEALLMIKSIKGYKILEGFRGKPKANIERLAGILANVSKLAIEDKNIQEIDFNPIMANGNDVFIVDPKIILET